MSVDTVELTGPGTSEDEWLPWLSRQLRYWPALDIRAIATAVVVAPHPDDEVLAAGGLLAQVDHPTVIGLTDGEASHPRSPTVTPATLAERRRAERREALRLLREPAGLDPVQIIESHLRDGSLSDQEAYIADLLEGHLSPDCWCIAPWPHEGHPDHEAAGRAAATACQRSGARLLSYPVWAWHWARPADPRLPWQCATSLSLPAATAEAKARAIAAFGSQIHALSDASEDAPILPAGVLARFRRPYEVFFR